MREAITNLSKQQNLQLQRLLHHYGLDTKTSTKTQRYYRQLRKIHYQLDQQTYSIDDMMKASIVIAQKSQIMYTIKGEKIKGFSLSLNEMIKSNISLVKLINIIKLFITNSKFLQEELRQDLNQLVQQATFGLNYLQKFQRAIQYFDFIQLVDKSYCYLNTFKSFTWIFFLQSRQKLQIASQFESDYLLISIMYLMVRYAFDYLRPNNIPQLNHGRVGQKHFITSVLQKLFQIFLIDDVANFKRITSMVDDYFQKLISLRLIKCNHYDYYDFLCPKLINVNYRKIDSLYQKQRDPNSIDYRLFLNNRLPTLTPRRFSQLSQKQDEIVNNKKSFKQKSFASHKILTFEPEEQHFDKEQGVKFHPIKLPNNIKVSPSNVKIPLIYANRRSPYSPIQNFILRQIKNLKITDKSFDDEQQILSCLKAVLSQYCNCSQLLEDKVMMTYQYYLVLVQKFFAAQKQIDQDDYNGLYSSLLIYALQIVICSLSQRQQQMEDLKRTHLRIKDFIVTDSYYLWIVNKYFSKQASKLPTFLRTMPLIMKQLILTQFIWEQDDVVYQLIKKVKEPLNQSKSIHEKNMDQLLQAVFAQIKLNITNILSEFQEIDNLEQMSAKIQQTMKYIIVQCSEIIKSRSLLHILVSSVYLVLRSNGSNIKFNDIVIVFQQINHINANYYKKLLHSIEVSNIGQVQYCNIIEYYNRSFLPYIKGHLENIKKWNINSKRNSLQKEGRGSIRLTIQNNHRYKSVPSQQSEQKSNNLTQQSHSEHSQKLEKESSPRISLPLNRKKQQVTDSITRKQTTIRSRPITAMLNCLNTEKIKSPSIIR